MMKLKGLILMRKPTRKLPANLIYELDAKVLNKILANQIQLCNIRIISDD